MRGFTVIETLVTIAIFTLALGGITGFIVMGYRAYGFAWQQSIAIDEARKGIEKMAKEIRESRSGDNGSYAIESAGDKEFVFYSDIDKDAQTERVRYFLGTVNSGSQIQNCVTYSGGGSCGVVFPEFLQGNLTSAAVKVSVEGDFGAGNEYAEIFADGNKLGDVCQSGCADCAGNWQGTTIYDVFDYAQDGSVDFLADSSNRVDPNCNWEEANHSMKANFELSWAEEISAGQHELKKGVTEPTGDPPQYLSENEQVSVVISYVRNAPPIFEYFDENGNKIESYPARLANTKMMKLRLIINVNPERSPEDFELTSQVQLRNLKTKL